MNNQLRKIRNELKNVCQLCGRKVSKLQCDHDHVTELARGFVCEWCNRHVIPAGEHRPELVSDKVRAYLLTPPLLRYQFSYKNPMVRSHYYFHTVCMRDGWLRTAYREEKEVAQAFTRDDSSTIITYSGYDYSIQTEFVGADELMQFIIKERPVRCDGRRMRNRAQSL